MSELERIRKIGKVTGTLQDWQGLYKVLSGLYVIALIAVYQLPYTLQLWGFLFIGLVVLFANGWIKHYYAVNFGLVNKPKESQESRRLRIAGIVSLFIPFVAFIVLMASNQPYLLNIFGPLMVVSTCFFIGTGAFLGGVFRIHYLVLAAILTLVCGCLLVLGASLDWLVISNGVCIVVIGIIDHRNFVSLLKPIESESNAAV